MKTEIDRWVAEIAPDPGPGMTPGARELFEEIIAAPAVAAGPAAPMHRRRRPNLRRQNLRHAGARLWPPRRWRITVPLIAGLAATALAISWVVPHALVLGPRPAAAAFDIVREDGNYLIKVKRLFAEPERYEAQLRDLGLDISVRLQPVSPSLEGSVIAQGGGITTTQRAGMCGDWLLCPIELRVPVGFQGKASVLLGRRARPGERYRGMGRIEMPGEPLHCVDFVNKTVDQVRSMLRERGVTIGTFASDRRGMRPSVPGSWYVHEGVLREPGKAILLVGPKRHRDPVPLNAFCPKGS